MLHTNDPIIKHKVGLLNPAEELRNISKACQVMGLSRETFYRYKQAVEDRYRITAELRIDVLLISRTVLTSTLRKR